MECPTLKTFPFTIGGLLTQFGRYKSNHVRGSIDVKNLTPPSVLPWTVLLRMFKRFLLGPKLITLKIWPLDPSTTFSYLELTPYRYAILQSRVGAPSCR